MDLIDRLRQSLNQIRIIKGLGEVVGHPFADGLDRLGNRWISGEHKEQDFRVTLPRVRQDLNPFPIG